MWREEPVRASSALRSLRGVVMSEKYDVNSGKHVGLRYVCAVASIVFFLGAAGLASAATPQEELVNTLTNIRNLLIAVGTVIAAIGYILTAYMWMTSTGNPEQRSKARKYFMDVTFGIFLLFISSFLVQLAQSLVV